MRIRFCAIRFWGMDPDPLRAVEIISNGLKTLTMRFEISDVPCLVSHPFRKQKKPTKIKRRIE